VEPWRTSWRSAAGGCGRPYFNSATAVEPWRTHTLTGTPGPGIYFNSATAVEPWRTPGALRRAAAKARTSIRPRRWSRGGRTASIGFLPKKGRLQFGHGGGAVEDQARGSPPRRRQATSIRPRRWSRGGPSLDTWGGLHRSHFNSATAVEPWRTRLGRASQGENGGTSIRPRRWSRGGPAS